MKHMEPEVKVAEKTKIDLKTRDDDKKDFPKLHEGEQGLLEQPNGVAPVVKVEETHEVTTLSAIFDLAKTLVSELLFPCEGAKVEGNIAYELPAGYTSAKAGLSISAEKTEDGFKLAPAFSFGVDLDAVPTDIVDVGAAIDVKLSPHATAAELSDCWDMVKALCLVQIMEKAAGAHPYLANILTSLIGGDENAIAILVQAADAMTALPDFDEAKYETDATYRAAVDEERKKVATMGIDVETTLKALFQVKLGPFGYGVEWSYTRTQSSNYGMGKAGIEKVSTETETTSGKKAHVKTGVLDVSRSDSGGETTWDATIALPGNLGITSAIDLFAERIKGQDPTMARALRWFTLPATTALTGGLGGSVSVKIKVVDKGDHYLVSADGVTGMEAGLLGGKGSLERSVPIVKDKRVDKPDVPGPMDYHAQYTQDYYDKKSKAEQKKKYPGIMGLVKK